MGGSLFACSEINKQTAGQFVEQAASCGRLLCLKREESSHQEALFFAAYGLSRENVL